MWGYITSIPTSLPGASDALGPIAHPPLSLNFSHNSFNPKLLPRLLERGRLFPEERESQQRILHIIDGCGKKELVTSHSLDKT